MTTIRKQRAVTIGGIKVRPKWPWSKDYRSHFVAMMAKPRSNRDSHEAAAEKYCRWLAKRDGIDLSEATHFDALWHYAYVTTSTGRQQCRAVAIKAIRFEKAEPYEQRRWYAGGRWRGEDSPRETIATIQIPHFDFRPNVATLPLAA